MVKSLVSTKPNPKVWEQTTPPQKGWLTEEDVTMNSEEDESPEESPFKRDDVPPPAESNSSPSFMGMMKKLQTDATRRLSSGWTASPMRRVTLSTPDPNKKKE